jgi:hypothetical protein
MIFVPQKWKLHTNALKFLLKTFTLLHNHLLSNHVGKEDKRAPFWNIWSRKFPTSFSCKT